MTTSDHICYNLSVVKCLTKVQIRAHLQIHSHFSSPLPKLPSCHPRPLPLKRTPILPLPFPSFLLFQDVFHFTLQPFYKFFREMIFMAFIVDTYNKYNKWDREHSQFHFKINDVEYAIKEINDILELPRSIEDNTSLSTYFIYS